MTCKITRPEMIEIYKLEAFTNMLDSETQVNKFYKFISKRYSKALIESKDLSNVSFDYTSLKINELKEINEFINTLLK